jgi:protein-disulfide isomerase
MAANAQGKFWEMHDKMFANQQALDRASLEKYAQEIGLNLGRFKADMDGHKQKDQIDADSKAGTSYGANGTPTLFVNGRQLVGAQPFTAFQPIIDDEIKHADALLKKGVSMDKLYDEILKTMPAAPAPPPGGAPGAGEAPPEHVDIDPGDSPSKGPKSAPVVVLEFSDFQ